MWKGIKHPTAFKRSCTLRSWATIPSSPVNKYPLVFQYPVELWSVSSLNLGLEIPPLAVNQCRSQNPLHIHIANHKEPLWLGGCGTGDAWLFHCSVLLTASKRKMGLVWMPNSQSAKAILLKQTTGKNSRLFCCLTWSCHYTKNCNISNIDPFPTKDILMTLWFQLVKYLQLI